VVDRYLNINEIDVSEPITTEHLFYDEIIYEEDDDEEDELN
jgi:hypothetical protein